MGAGDVVPAVPAGEGTSRRPALGPVTVAAPAVAGAARSPVGQRRGQLVRQGTGVGRVADRVAEHLPQHRQVAATTGDAGGQGLHGGEAEALLGRREGEDVGLGHQGRQPLVVDRTEHERLDAPRRAGRVERGPVVAVVEQGLAARDHQADRSAPGREQAHRLDQVEGALAGLDAPDGEHHRARAERRPPARPGPPPRHRPPTRPARSARPRPRSGSRWRRGPTPRPARRPRPGDTHTWATGVTIARSWQRASSGVVKWSRWWTVRITPAGPGDGVGRDAVLGVDDVVGAGIDGRGQRVDRPQHPGADGLAGDVGQRRQPHGRPPGRPGGRTRGRHRARGRAP